MIEPKIGDFGIKLNLHVVSQIILKNVNRDIVEVLSVNFLEIYQLCHMIVALLSSFLISVLSAGMAFSPGVSSISIAYGSSRGHCGFSDSSNYMLPSAQDVASMLNRLKSKQFSFIEVFKSEKYQNLHHIYLYISHHLDLNKNYFSNARECKLVIIM